MSASGEESSRRCYVDEKWIGDREVQKPMIQLIQA
jgi:hypothetical protein